MSEHRARVKNVDGMNTIVLNVLPVDLSEQLQLKIGDMCELFKTHLADLNFEVHITNKNKFKSMGEYDEK